MNRMMMGTLLVGLVFSDVSIVAKQNGGKKDANHNKSVIECRLLSEDFDLALLRNEFEDALKKFIIPRQANSNLWHGIPLQNVGGFIDARGLQIQVSIKPDRMEKCIPTPYLEKVPYIKAILERIERVFGAKTGLVRIFRLPSENALPAHQDGPVFNFESGKVIRLHIPIITSPSVQFIINNKAYRLAAGKMYFTNVSLTHSVINNGNFERIHLIIDVHANKALRAFIRKCKEPPYTMIKRK